MSAHVRQPGSTLVLALVLGFAVGTGTGMLVARVIDRGMTLDVRGSATQPSGEAGAAGPVALVVDDGAGTGVSEQKDRAALPAEGLGAGAVAGHGGAAPGGHEAVNCQVCAKKAFDALGASPDEGGGKTIGGMNTPASRGGRRGVTAPGSGK